MGKLRQDLNGASRAIKPEETGKSPYGHDDDDDDDDEPRLEFTNKVFGRLELTCLEASSGLRYLNVRRAK
jgi:hypothetical protein